MKQKGARAGGQDTENVLDKSPVKKRVVSGQWTKNFDIEFETQLQQAELGLNEKKTRIQNDIGLIRNETPTTGRKRLVSAQIEENSFRE